MSLRNLLAQQATVYPKVGRNKYGRDISGDPVQVACRFQNATKLITLPNQQVIQLFGIFYFDGSVSITTEDRVVFGTDSYKIFSVNGSIDGRGQQILIKCQVTKWQTT